MSDQNRSDIVVNTEECSTNMYFTYGKEEVFNCQITVRGNPSPEKIQAHVQSAIETMKCVVNAGGHAKQVGAGSSQSNSSASPSPPSQFEFYKGNKGKTYIKLNGAAEPNEITCPVHNAKMKRRTNDEGSWYSHKGPDDKWCSVTVPGKE